jgi:hypothetical protein
MVGQPVDKGPETNTLYQTLNMNRICGMYCQFFLPNLRYNNQKVKSREEEVCSWQWAVGNSPAKDRDGSMGILFICQFVNWLIGS